MFLAFNFSCSKKHDPTRSLDRQTKMSRDEIKNSLVKNPDKNKESKRDISDSQIPEIAALEIAPPQPIDDNDILNNKKLISFSATQDVDVKDLLIEISRIAKIDVNIDPEISGGIIISANKKPLGQVIERIATLANLRYHYSDGVLHFEKDSPYLKNYFVDYLVEGSELWTDVQSNLTQIIASTSDSPSSINVNKSAGLMSIFANDKQHKKIAEYLSDVAKSSSAQVLIEAKVVEVKLDDEYKTGVDWSFLGASANGRSSDIDINDTVTGLDGTSSAFRAVLSGTDLTLTVSALEKFGTTRTLSSPRVHAINNKKATLEFVDKFVYFQIENTATNTGGANAAVTLAETISSTKLEEDIGVILAITPSINIDTNEVTLNINPTITVKSDEVEDPASPVIDGTRFPNVVPVIQTREIETIAKVQSGNAIVIGGLMKESTTNIDTGVPFLKNIPILGNLFKSSSRDSEIVETVIFIKATIINSSSQVEDVDRELQEKFDTNRRKFF